MRCKLCTLVLILRLDHIDVPEAALARQRRAKKTIIAIFKPNVAVAFHRLRQFGITIPHDLTTLFVKEVSELSVSMLSKN